MFQVTYDIDYSALKEFLEAVKRQIQAGALPETAQAVQASLTYAASEWIHTAESKFKHSQGNYARGIQSGINYPYQGDPLHGSIIHTDKNAYYLEYGYDSFDMKKALLTSDKVRMTKDGKRYLVIPFRHGTPGSKEFRPMPKEIYEAAPIMRREIVNGKVQFTQDPEIRGAKNLRQSVIRKTYEEGSIKGAKDTADADLMRKFNQNKVLRNYYEWKDKIGDVDVGKTIKRADGSFKTYDSSIYSGMVRMQANPNIAREQLGLGKFSGINSTDNMRNYSLYYTFRIMHEDSKGWIHPGLKPMNILKETKERLEPQILETISQGVQKDMKTILGN